MLKLPSMDQKDIQKKSNKSKTKLCFLVAMIALACAPVDPTGICLVIGLIFMVLGLCAITYHGSKKGIHMLKSVGKLKRRIDSNRPHFTPGETSSSSQHEPGESSDSSEQEFENLIEEYQLSHGHIASEITGIGVSLLMAVALPTALAGVVINTFLLLDSLNHLRGLKRKARKAGINFSEVKTDVTKPILLGVLIKLFLTAITLGHDDVLSITTSFGINIDSILDWWYNVPIIDALTNIATVPHDWLLAFLGLANDPTWADVLSHGVTFSELFEIGAASELNVVQNLLAHPLLEKFMAKLKKEKL